MTQFICITMSHLSDIEAFECIRRSNPVDASPINRAALSRPEGDRADTSLDSHVSGRT